MRNRPDDVTDAQLDRYMCDPNEWQADWLTTELARRQARDGIDLNKLAFDDLKELVDAVELALDDHIADQESRADQEADYRRDRMRDEGW